MRTLLFILFYMAFTALNVKADFHTPLFMTIFTVVFAILDFTEPNRTMHITNYIYSPNKEKEKL